MSIGLDTSVVLRLLTGQPAREAGAARRRVERAVNESEKILVTDLVLGETYFALHYHYGVPKEEARARILAMLRANVVVASPSEAVAAFEPAKGAGVMDRLIHVRHRSAHAMTLTFDRSMGALEGAVRLSAR